MFNPEDKNEICYYCMICKINLCGNCLMEDIEHFKIHNVEEIKKIKEKIKKSNILLDITKEQYDYVLYKDEKITAEVERLKNTFVGSATRNQEYLETLGSAPLRTGTSLAELLCRPEITYENLSFFDKEREPLSDDIIEQVCIRIKYEGYIEIQERQVAAFKKMEKKLIPEDIDYDEVSSLRLEARQKLKLFKPRSVGQASRISGVTPADVSVLLIYLASIGK